MQKTGSLQRQQAILKFVKMRPYTTFEEIRDKLNDEGFDLSERTLQRDIQHIREAMFIDIQYNRGRNGYFIDTDSDNSYLEWMQIFETLNRTSTIKQILSQNPGNIDVIDFDKPAHLASEFFFSDALQAIVQRRKVRFNYQRFYEDELEGITLEPLLLKEYLNRWYLVGKNHEGNVRGYGLERIADLVLTSDTFKPSIKNPKQLYADVVGLISENERERVVLSYQAFQGNYIKTQPLHATQKILVDNADELRIEIYVRPNYELEEQILKQGERVTVLEPQWLRNEIKAQLKKALEGY